LIYTTPIQATMTSPALDFSTCDLCDALKTDPDLRVLPPVFVDFGGRKRFAGPVSTLKCHEDNSMLKSALESVGAGRVLVVDGGASMRRALLGGNLGLAAVRNGWAGILIDGCVRDVNELGQLDLGILALASLPLATEKRGAGQADVVVQVQGVTVRPGDWLYADEDGALVVSKALR